MDDISRSSSPAQPVTDRESFPSTAAALADAAEAFKATLGQSSARQAQRGDRQESAGGGADEEDADEHSVSATPEKGAEPEASQEAGHDETEAAEAVGQDPDGDAQPAAVAMPASWSREDRAMWSALPPETQAKIAEREGQRDAAINLRLQEAANLRKAQQAEIEEANHSRRLYAEAVDEVLSLVVPQPPPISMLDVQSSDYDPDTYHYQKALHEETVAFLNSHAAQRHQIAAQEQQQQFGAINGATRDAFIRSVPDVADQAKAPAVFQELMDYAVSLGTPPDVFASPTTALEWHVLWKAREYDRLQTAKARVKETPPPEPRKAQPAVRPGVASPRSAIEQSRRQGAMERLRQEGSVEAGAAALKHLLKGQLS